MNARAALERYRAALDVFRTISAQHGEAQAAYRARKIDDVAFLASRAAFDRAMAALDSAEREVSRRSFAASLENGTIVRPR